MKNVDIAKAYIKDAEIILEEARESFQKGYYHRTVRKCQESVELALKGVLRLKGIEYPKFHKIGKVLVDVLVGDIDPVIVQKVADISDQLAIDREPSFYGSEDTPAEKLFDKEDALDVIEKAESVMGFVLNLLK